MKRNFCLMSNFTSEKDQNDNLTSSVSIDTPTAAVMPDAKDAQALAASNLKEAFN